MQIYVKFPEKWIKWTFYFSLCVYLFIYLLLFFFLFFFSFGAGCTKFHHFIYLFIYFIFLQFFFSFCTWCPCTTRNFWSVMGLFPIFDPPSHFLLLTFFYKFRWWAGEFAGKDEEGWRAGVKLGGSVMCQALRPASCLTAATEGLRRFKGSSRGKKTEEVFGCELTNFGFVDHIQR